MTQLEVRERIRGLTDRIDRVPRWAGDKYEREYERLVRELLRLREHCVHEPVLVEQPKRMRVDKYNFAYHKTVIECRHCHVTNPKWDMGDVIAAEARAVDHV